MSIWSFLGGNKSFPTHLLLEWALTLPCPDPLTTPAPGTRLSFPRLPATRVGMFPKADLQHTKALLVLEVQPGSEPHRSAYLVYMKQLLCIKIWSLLGDIGA